MYGDCVFYVIDQSYCVLCVILRGADGRGGEEAHRGASSGPLHAAAVGRCASRALVRAEAAGASVLCGSPQVELDKGLYGLVGIEAQATEGPFFGCGDWGGSLRQPVAPAGPLAGQVYTPQSGTLDFSA